MYLPETSAVWGQACTAVQGAGEFPISGYSAKNGSTPSATARSAMRYAAAFHDWPGMPPGVSVLPCNHSVKAQFFTAHARASFTNPSGACGLRPLDARAVTQNPPTMGHMPPL